MALKIKKNDGTVVAYDRAQYDTYEWHTGVFVVKKGNQWIGMYNTESIESVTVQE